MMISEDIMRIIEKGESLLIEFKKATDAVPSSFYDTVASFSNTDGGTILLGVDKDGNIEGINPLSETQIKLNIITSLNTPDLIYPPVMVEPFSVQCNDRLVMVVQVPASSQIHKYHGRIFKRAFEADIDISKNQTQLREMYLRKSKVFTEVQIIPHLSFTDLDPSLFQKARTLIRNMRSDHPWLLVDDEQMLRESALWRKDFFSNQEGLTLAAALIFGSETTIKSLLPAYKVEIMVRIQNPDRWDDRLTLRKNLIDSYLEIKQFVYRYLPEKFFTDKDQRIDLRDKIFREVIGNVLVHREYTSNYSTDIIISDTEVTLSNPNIPLFHGIIDPKKFNPYPKNPNIRKFFVALGWADEIGSGIRNTNKYLPLYIPGAKPVFSENDTFTTTIPLLFVSLERYTKQIQEWLGLKDEIFSHLQKGLLQVPIHVKLKDASWKEVLFYLVPAWHLKGTNLPDIEWPVNHPFAKSYVPDKAVIHDRSTNLDEITTAAVNRDGTNLTDKNRVAIQTLISIGEDKVPTWHESGTNFLHKKVMYIITILIICTTPISLSELMQFMAYANRKTFRDNYLSPLRKVGFIELTIPDNINDPEQKYKLTESGRAFLAGTLK